ncbi:MAG: ABC transporter ATP-binding protein [Gemmatimonadota bacterium]
MIQLEGLTKRYGDVVAVDGLDLEVASGEIFGLLGPNGAGKTTTLRMMVGILRPDAGRILVAGRDMAEEPRETRRLLGFVPDRPFVYEKLTGAELLRFVAGLWGQEGPDVEERIDELLELWDLAAWRDRLVESYSHGMRQKLILSTALIHRPTVLVIDEPMVGLDPASARLLKRVLRSFADAGGTVLISTHTLEFAEVLCDRLAVLQGGQVLTSGTMETLRKEAELEGGRLEAVFLKLVGDVGERRLARALGDAP